ncbi:dual specificity protein phosphatase 26 [Lates japonicus]|uniref:Dual specificity protein phosphatase n=1 Tax=Lates japonicus TaxID=270547 RepID=A0AAD3NEF8_LATJO|nr:dual specificity protein phosphatase 26 [Lates japonicus]
MSRFSRSRSSSRSPSRKDSERASPILTVSELERLLYTGKTACNHADEVWPRLYIGDQDIASDRRELAKLGITHILNCAQSKWRGGAEYYAGMNITYHGIEAHDSPTFDMSVNFYPAAEFIHKALTSGGKVLGPLHCGSEPLSHSGSGLPDDQTEPDPVSYQDGQRPPRCHPQPRLSSASSTPGRHPEGEP